MWWSLRSREGPLRLWDPGTWSLQTLQWWTGAGHLFSSSCSPLLSDWCFNLKAFMDFSSRLFLLMVQTSTLNLDLHWIIYYILITTLYLKNSWCLSVNRACNLLGGNNNFKNLGQNSQVIEAKMIFYTTSIGIMVIWVGVKKKQLMLFIYLVSTIHLVYFFLWMNELQCIKTKNIEKQKIYLDIQLDILRTIGGISSSELLPCVIFTVVITGNINNALVCKDPLWLGCFCIYEVGLKIKKT